MAFLFRSLVIVVRMTEMPLSRAGREDGSGLMPCR